MLFKIQMNRHMDTSISVYSKDLRKLFTGNCCFLDRIHKILLHDFQIYFDSVQRKKTFCYRIVNKEHHDNMSV